MEWLKYKIWFKKIIIILILGFWFISLLPGLILESRHIRGRYIYFAHKNPDQKEEIAAKIELSIPGEGDMYNLVKKYIVGIKDGHN